MAAKIDPIARFRRVYARAQRKDPGDHTRVALATADAAGRPSVRMVLLRGFDERGFVFYTNYGSRKALELEANPRAALCFYWEWTGDQVRVEGDVERVSAAESDAYFASRGRGSQLAAWASRQSAPLESRKDLVTEYLHFKARFARRPVPRPDFWGGYRLRPQRLEFWSSRAHRLHDRTFYERDGDGWTSGRLYP
ncbi:MAG TPA: pyridoxamine 5'-phosphate oxidase [Acidobacteriota bacterium]